MPFNFGAFAGGLSQGLLQGQKMQLEAQAHKLKAKMLETQQKAMEFDQQEKQRKAQEQANQQVELGKYVDMLSRGVPQQVTPGYESPEQQMSVAPVESNFRPATPQELMGQGLKSIPQEHRYNLIQQSMKPPTGAAASRAFATPQEALAFKNSEEYRQLYPYGARLNQTSRGLAFEGINPQDAANNAFHAELNKSGDRVKATQAYNDVLYGKGASGAAGRVAGEAGQFLGEPVAPMVPMQPGLSQPTLAPTPSPQPQPAPAPQPTATPGPPGETPAQRAARLKAEIKKNAAPVPEGQANKLVSNQHVQDSIKRLEDNFDPSFLGPVQGTDIAFAARRRIGSSIGYPLSDQETKFRQELANLKNAALYDASGAQINEQEQKRIANVLPSASDEPSVFRAGLARYKAEVEKLGLRRREMVGETRGSVGQPKRYKFNPQTGKLE